MRSEARRLVRAVLLGLAVFLFVGGGTGFALAAGDGGRDGVLRVPAPGPGDRATYSAQAIVLDPDTAKAFDASVQLTVEWLEPVRVAGRDFVVRDVHPLRATYLWNAGTQVEATYVRDAYYDAVTGKPVLNAVNGSYESDGSNLGLLLEDAVGSPPERTDFRFEMFLGKLGECAMRLPLHGRDYDGGPVAALGRCGWLDGGEIHTYLGRGWQGKGADRAYAFEGAQDARFEVAFDGTSPFPARFHSALANLLSAPYTQGRYFALERTSSERSGRAYPAPSPPVPLGEVAVAARTPWILDDTGLQHSFPLREAYMSLLAEPDQPDTPATSHTTAAEFLAARPDAYVAVAVFQYVADRQGSLHPNWWLALTDGKDVLAKRVERGPMSAQGLYLPPQAGSEDSVSEWNAYPEVVPDDATGVFPPPGNLPGHMPAVADLLARYQDLAQQPADGYGFDIRCRDARCADVDAFAWAGVSSADINNGVNVVGDPLLVDRTVMDGLWVDPEGLLVSRVAYRSLQDGPFQVVPSQVQDDDGAPSVQAAGPGVWSLPPTGAVASLSFLALVASALYYFWPAIKGAAGVGLFSRIQDDKLLDHPRRAELLQLVQAEPGIHFQDLARRLGMGRGTLDHHLRKMLAASLLIKVQNSGYTCYFPKGVVDRRVMAAAPALRSGGSRAVFDAVKANPGRSSRDLAAQLGLAPSTVSYHLKRLQDAGLVFGDGAGTRLSPLGEQAA